MPARFQQGTDLQTAVTPRRSYQFSIGKRLCQKVRFLKKNQNMSQFHFSHRVFGLKCEKAPHRYVHLKSEKMTNLPTAVTFSLSALSQIRTHFWKRGAILYNICENHTKIPILSCISDVEAKTVQTGGSARGGQRGRIKGPGGK